MSEKVGLAIFLVLFSCAVVIGLWDLGWFRCLVGQ